MIRVGLFGPLVGRNPGRVTTQGEKLTDALAAAGYETMSASSHPNRYRRLADIASTIVRHRKRFDVMIVFTYAQASFVVEDLASLLGSQFDVPIVLALCGGAFPDFSKRFPNWTQRVLKRATALVCQSEYLARGLRDLGHTAVVIPNLMDVAPYQYRHRHSVQPKLFWMRAFEDLYNPNMALRVLDRVRRRYPAASLVMAGQDLDGQQRRIEQTARDMGLGDAVRFAGFLDHHKKQVEGDAADIFINTPRIDNRPICVVEACALGLPVVSTNVGGIADLVQHERTALLVDDDDDDAMATAVARLVEERDLANTLSRNGRSLAAESSVERVLPRWDELLRSAVNREAFR